jgi:prepilin-type N-terminal cleavage/methylation domain-containing protein
MLQQHLHEKHAFTLIELLVVISIISVLIALLLPVLSRSREAARNVQCLAQLKQWAMAHNNYAADFKEWLPAGENWSATYIDAYVGMYFGDSKGSYTNIKKMLMCPAHGEYVHGQSGSGMDSLAWGYSLQGEYEYWGGNGNYNKLSTGDWADIGWRYPTYFHNGHKPTPWLNHPFVLEVGASNRVLMADAANYTSSGGINTPYTASNNITYVNHRGGGDVTRPTGINLMYVDGHARTSPAWTSGDSVYMWNGGRGRINWVP